MFWAETLQTVNEVGATLKSPGDPEQRLGD